MITLKSPKSQPSLVGYDIIEVTDNYRGKYCNVTIEEVYSDGSRVARSFTLWMDVPAVTTEAKATTAYTDIGEWTDEDVKARVEAILSAT